MPTSRRVACFDAYCALHSAHLDGLATAVLDGVCQDLRIDPVRLYEAIAARRRPWGVRRDPVAPATTDEAETGRLNTRVARQAEVIAELFKQRDGLRAALRGLYQAMARTPVRSFETWLRWGRGPVEWRFRRKAVELEDAYQVAVDALEPKGKPEE